MRALGTLFVAAIVAVTTAAPAAAAPRGGLARVAGSLECVQVNEPSRTCDDGGAAGMADIALSPDDRFAYAIASDVDAVVVLRRNRSTRRLARVEGPAGCLSQTGANGHCAVARALRNPSEIEVSRDGLSVYVAGAVTQNEIGVSRTAPVSATLAVFRRDPQTGALEQLPGAAGCHSPDGSDGAGNDCTPVRGPAPVGDDIEISADGRHVYSAGGAGVAAFVRDEASGALAQLPGPAGCVAAGEAVCTPVRALAIPFELALAPDGATLYVADFGPIDTFSDGGLVVLNRDPASGALAQPPGPGGCVSPYGGGDCTINRMVLRAIAVAVSPDSRHVYVGADQYSALVGFAHDPAGGPLRQVACVRGFATKRPGCVSSVAGFTLPGVAAFADGGATAYAHADRSDALETLRRDPETGALTPAGCTTDYTFRGYDCSAIGDFGGGAAAVAADGTAYVTSLTTMVALAPGLGVDTARIVLTRAGEARVVLRCDAAYECRGSARLYGFERSPLLAAADVSVPAGESRTVGLSVPATARQYLRVRRSIDAEVVTRIAAPGKPTLEATSLVALRIPAAGLAGGRRAQRCLPADAEPVRRTRLGTIYLRLARLPGSELDLQHYGCLFSTGRPHLLDENDGEYGYFPEPPYHMSGHYLAFPMRYVSEGTGDDDTTDLVVFDLVRGRSVNHCTGCGFFVRLVLRPTGSVAWSEHRAIYKLEPGGRAVELDEGDGIEEKSLRLRGSKVTWIKDGRRRSATLR